MPATGTVGVARSQTQSESVRQALFLQTPFPPEVSQTIVVGQSAFVVHVAPHWGGGVGVGEGVGAGDALGLGTGVGEGVGAGVGVGFGDGDGVGVGGGVGNPPIGGVGLGAGVGDAVGRGEAREMVNVS